MLKPIAALRYLRARPFVILSHLLRDTVERQGWRKLKLSDCRYLPYSKGEAAGLGPLHIEQWIIPARLDRCGRNRSVELVPRTSEEGHGKRRPSSRDGKPAARGKVGFTSSVAVAGRLRQAIGTSTAP